MSSVKSILAELELRPSKRRGQNFLVDPGSVRKVIEFARIAPNFSVLEVGPGLGALSELLRQQAADYWAIEIEKKFCNFLCQKGIPAENVICADIRDIDLSQLGDGAPGRWIVVSNVPYSLSTDFLLWLLVNRKQIVRANLLLQREFAERIAANAGTKVYGSLSVLFRLFSDVTLGPVIGGRCFYPAAEVESRLLEICFLPQSRYEVTSTSYFESVVRRAFSKRRKTLLNALLGEENISKERLTELLIDAGISPSSRAEELTLENFVSLVKLLEKTRSEQNERPPCRHC